MPIPKKPLTRKTRPPTYMEIVRQAVKQASDPQNYVSVDQIMQRLHNATTASFKPLNTVEKELKSYYQTIYQRITKQTLGSKEIPRYTRANLTKEAQEEVAKKVVSSIQLIKLDREIAVAITLRKFAGWVSSVPAEGTAQPAKAQEIIKEMRRLPYREKRVIVDQGHKLVATLEDVICRGTGAIAAMWHSHVHQAGYNYRVDHAIRDQKIYLLRNSWADKEELVIPLYGYTDQQTMPAEEVNCRCYYQYFFNLQDLPPDMLTAKAKQILGLR